MNYINFIKPWSGIVLVSTIFFGALTKSACNKDSLTEKESVFVRIKNNYFEGIDSVHIDTLLYGKISSQNVSVQKIFSKGNYTFWCITQSQLKISATLSLKSYRDSIVIVLNEKGRLLIE